MKCDCSKVVLIFDQVYIFVLQERESVNRNIGSLYPAFDHLQGHAVRHPVPHMQQVNAKYYK